ncbi:MAG: hypothetical protein Q7S40_10395 [Opitutaceae bacterium]|nr:hypothetical protein [Opitutaceae bacterium]
MFSRRIVFPLLAVAIAVALWFQLQPNERNAKPRAVEPPRGEANARSPENSNRGDAPAAHDRATITAIDPAGFPLAAPLNAPGSTAARDLEALSHILDAWRSNFPRDGNPVGENREITAALTGENTLQLVLIPKRHPAVNAHGELCDRWGTPYRFHQLSGDRMELRSAGPDRKFGTADDVEWSPGS